MKNETPFMSQMKEFERLFARKIEALRNLDEAREQGKPGYAMNNYKRAVRHWANKIEALELARAINQ
jgi:hypothetical protein